jgi:hypothetical protein
LNLLSQQYEQAKIELEQMRNTRDMYRRELEASSNKNIQNVHDLVNNNVRFSNTGNNNRNFDPSFKSPSRFDFLRVDNEVPANRPTGQNAGKSPMKYDLQPGDRR